jgi:DNA-binding NtrC family response regulator
MEQSRPRILVVDDEEHQRTALAAMIAGWGYQAESASNGEEALELLETYRADAIVTDLKMPVMDGRTLLTRLREQDGAPPAIVLTAFGNLETALHTVHELGAFWFLEKPLQPSAMRLLLERAVAQRRLSDDRERLERRLQGEGMLGDLVGSSRVMAGVFAVLRQVAPTRATVLITGESGTGKELAARAIHRLSPRAAGPFVAINCAALPESLIESELFGHEKGAFTGAIEKRRGCFELADGGTLFLDEIGEMPAATQSRLLRVLEDRKVRRLGAQREVEVDVRLVVATNRDLAAEVAKSRFREDLYFRLNVFHVHLPALRERLDDIRALCAALINDLNLKHNCRVSGIDDAALETLRAHNWPGNVRELRNVLERAVILAGEGVIGAAHLSGLSAARPAPAADDSVALRPGTTIEEAERILVELTLRHTGGNRTRAAALLGISPKTLFNKLRESASAADG